MIDLIIVKGALGSPQECHQDRLAKVTYSRFFSSKCKPTTTFIDSPLTGKQLELKYWVESVAGMSKAFVEIKLPLASATVGQNYIHAGLDSIQLETKAASKFCRLLLNTVGFSEIEVQTFMTTAEVELVELTWHTPTRNPRAAMNLQKRTRQVFEDLQAARSRHDLAVQNVETRIRNGMPCLLVEFKGGDELRQYGKYFQVLAKSQRGRQRLIHSPEMAKVHKDLVPLIESHVRNECRIERETLKSLGALNPRSWNDDVLKKAIDVLWGKAGFRNTRMRGASKDKLDLSPEQHATWERYEAGEQVKGTLPSYTFTRHRKAIRCAKGADIARPRRGKQANPESVGYQLQYERRWKPTADLKKLTLCEETAPAIIEDLDRGLAYIKDGEIPEFQDDATRDRWVKRWRSYAEREWLCRPAQFANTPHKNLRTSPSRKSPRFARGIGNAPLMPNAVDKLIYLDGEPYVI